MLIPTIRMVKAALEDPTTGVNAQLAALALDGTDARPEAIVAVLDPTADDVVVRDKTTLVEWPVLVVTAEAPTVTTSPTVTGLKLEAPEMTVTVAYVTRDGDGAQGFRDADYTLAACVKALAAGLFAANKGAARQRNGYAILRQLSTTIQPIGAAVEGVGTIAGALLVTLHVREQ